MSHFDVVFISYDEDRAESNFEHLQKLVPKVKRVHKVKGIARAWKTAASLAETSHFFTVDGDIYVDPHFDWQIENFLGDRDNRVHVYRSRNNVNGLVYGYGSIHLFPTQLVRNFNDLSVVDFTLAVAKEGFEIQERLASTTCFNTSPYHSWKSGFREAAKLASGNNAYTGTTPDERSLKRLEVWCSLGADVEFGRECILGARMGALWGFERQNIDEVSDFSWLAEEFDKIPIGYIHQLLIDAKEDLKKYHNFVCHDINPKESKSIKTWLGRV